MLSPTERVRRVAAKVAATAALTAAVGIAAPSAHATIFTYYSGNVAAGGKKAHASQARLWSSVSWLGNEPNRYARAGAHYSGGWTLYGSWVVGNPDYACAGYSAAYDKGAILYNAHSVSVFTNGVAAWGVSSDAIC